MNLPGRRVRREAESALLSARRALAALSTREIDVGPAVRLRDRAHEAFESRRYAKARDLARKAEETAHLLEKLHSAAARAIEKLQVEKRRMSLLGIDTREVDESLASAQAWMTRFIDRDGDARFPGYGRAGDEAVRGLKRGAELVPAFKRAVLAVSEAKRTVQREIEANTFVDPKLFRSFIMKPAMDVLAEAASRLKANDLSSAEELAKWTAATVNTLHMDYAAALEAYRSVEAVLETLRSEDGPTAEVEARLAAAKAAIRKGKFEEAREVCNKASETAARHRESHRELILEQRKAEEALERVGEWGFDTRKAAKKVEEGRLAIKSGRYDEARRRFAAARMEALGLREQHRLIAERLVTLRREVADLRRTDPAAAEDVEELLQQTDEDLQAGHYAACEENLQIAVALLGRRPGRASRRGREAEPEKGA